jgi:hypothetical protein
MAPNLQTRALVERLQACPPSQIWLKGLRLVACPGALCCSGAAHQERWLEQGHVQISDLCKTFGTARNFRKAAMRLGVGRHPDLLNNPAFGKRGSASKLHPILTRIFYHCSLDTMYKPLGVHAAFDKSAKGSNALRLHTSCLVPAGPLVFQPACVGHR